MQTGRRVILSALALAALVAAPVGGQTSVGGPFVMERDDGGPALMAEETRVVFDTSGGRIRGVVHFRYRNRGPGVAAISEGCGAEQPTLERWDGDRWRAAYATVRLGCLGPPMLVPVGATHRDSIVVDALPIGVPPGRLERGRYLVPVPGRYRLTWGVHDAVNLDRKGIGPDNTGPLRAEGERTSNELTIVVEPTPPDFLEATVWSTQPGALQRLRLWRDGDSVRGELRTQPFATGGPTDTRPIDRPQLWLRTALTRLDSLSRTPPPRDPAAPVPVVCGRAVRRFTLEVLDARATRLVLYDDHCAAVPPSEQAHLAVLRAAFEELAGQPGRSR